jgi:hypothetical protein
MARKKKMTWQKKKIGKRKECKKKLGIEETSKFQ